MSNYDRFGCHWIFDLREPLGVVPYRPEVPGQTAGTPAALVPAPLGLRRIYGSHLLQTGRPKEAAEVLRRVALEDGGPGVRR